MSEQKNKAAEGEKRSGARFELQRIYVKDLSFSAPEAIESFKSGYESPEIKLQLNTETHKLSAVLYEVALSLSVTAAPKGSSKFLYQVEAKQAGLFIIDNFPEQDLRYIINTSCPGILFPYARQLISGLVERGGFAPILLAPMNFEALHLQYLERLQQTANAPVDQKH